MEVIQVFLPLAGSRRCTSASTAQALRATCSVPSSPGHGHQTLYTQRSHFSLTAMPDSRNLVQGQGLKESFCLTPGSLCIYCSLAVNVKSLA